MPTISYRLSESPQCGKDVVEELGPQAQADDAAKFLVSSSTHFTPRAAMSKDQATARVVLESR